MNKYEAKEKKQQQKHHILCFLSNVLDAFYSKDVWPIHWAILNFAKTIWMSSYLLHCERHELGMPYNDLRILEWNNNSKTHTEILSRIQFGVDLIS